MEKEDRPYIYNEEEGFIILYKVGISALGLMVLVISILSFIVGFVIGWLIK